MEANSVFDITKPVQLKTGMHRLHAQADYNFQLNRLVNMDGADLETVKKVAAQIQDEASWKKVLLEQGEKELAQGHIVNAMAFYRMAEFYMDWKDPDGLAAWKKARELFFIYYGSCFQGEHPIAEQLEVPYEGYAMPVLRLNPKETAKGTIVMHGGFDSSYEEFFPAMLYLRQHGYRIYLFEGPGQGACIRLHGAPLIIEWEKPVMRITEYFDLQDVTLIGASLGGFYAPRAAAFDRRITKVVSWAQFPSLKMALNTGWKGMSAAMDIVSVLFGWAIDLYYRANIKKGGRVILFLDTYYHRLGVRSFRELVKMLWKIDIRPFGDKITQDVLIIGGSKDTMSYPTLIGRQMDITPNARSVSARLITEKEQGADHCNCGNQKLVMDTILLWLEGLRIRDRSIER